jgi:Protein of unknown function (DUF2914)
MRSTIGQATRIIILTCCLSLSMGMSMAHAVKDLVLLDASFASQITDRHPSRVPQSADLDSLVDSRLWFWVHVSCTGECAEMIAAKGHVKLFLDWYLEDDGVLRKQKSVSLSVKDTKWRSWGAKRVTPGTWVVVVRGEDSQWACLKSQCDFPIKVTPGKKKVGGPSQ